MEDLINKYREALSAYLKEETELSDMKIMEVVQYATLLLATTIGEIVATSFIKAEKEETE